MKNVVFFIKLVAITTIFFIFKNGNYKNLEKSYLIPWENHWKLFFLEIMKNYRKGTNTCQHSFMGNKSWLLLTNVINSLADKIIILLWYTWVLMTSDLGFIWHPDLQDYAVIHTYAIDWKWVNC